MINERPSGPDRFMDLFTLRDILNSLNVGDGSSNWNDDLGVMWDEENKGLIICHNDKFHPDGDYGFIDFYDEKFIAGRNWQAQGASEGERA